MKKSILIGVSIATVLAILLAAVALGFADTKTKFNAFADAKANEQVTEKTTQVATSTPTHVPTKEKTPEEAIAEAQAKVSFKILQPSYVPEGYTINTAKTTGGKFRGVSLELEQASIFYIKGNEYLTLGEQLITKDDTDVSESISKTPYKFVDINGVQGRFLEENDGVKSLSWKMGNLNFRISSYTYKESYSENESYFTGTSLSMEEMIKMARSVNEKTTETAIAEAQARVSFNILKPTYIPKGYALNIGGTSGTKFRGLTLEAEQAMLSYTNGKETLNLKELLVTKDNNVFLYRII